MLSERKSLAFSFLINEVHQPGRQIQPGMIILQLQISNVSKLNPLQTTTKKYKREPVSSMLVVFILYYSPSRL